jgi:hypothetical protein
MVGIVPTLVAYETTRLDCKYMCDEQLAFANNVFQIESPEEDRIDEPPFIEPSKKYKGITSGIVPLSTYAFSTTKGVDPEDMDGIKVFVPAIKRGEVSTEQLKMQLRMNKAVNKGTIRVRRKAELIDPNFGSYSLLEAEPVVEEVKKSASYFDRFMSFFQWRRTRNATTSQNSEAFRSGRNDL